MPGATLILDRTAADCRGDRIHRVRGSNLMSTTKALTTANVKALQKRLPKGSGTTAKAPTTYHY